MRLRRGQRREQISDRAQQAVQRGEGQRRLGLQALRAQHPEARRAAVQLVEQRRLADAGLAEHDEHPGPAGSGVGQQSRRAVRVPRSGRAAQPDGTPACRAGRVRCRLARVQPGSTASRPVLHAEHIRTGGGSATRPLDRGERSADLGDGEAVANRVTRLLRQPAPRGDTACRLTSHASGTIAWSKRTGGQLSSTERRQLLPPLALAHAHNLIGRTAMALRVNSGRRAALPLLPVGRPVVGTHPRRRGAGQAAAVAGAAQPLATAATASASPSPALEHIDVDRELLFAAAMLHDTGLAHAAARRRLHPHQRPHRARRRRERRTVHRGDRDDADRDHAAPQPRRHARRRTRRLPDERRRGRRRHRPAGLAAAAAGAPRRRCRAPAAPASSASSAGRGLPRPPPSRRDGPGCCAATARSTSPSGWPRSTSEPARIPAASAGASTAPPAQCQPHTQRHPQPTPRHHLIAHLVRLELP